MKNCGGVTLSKKLLYVSTSEGVHDQRFVDTALSDGWSVSYLRCGGFISVKKNFEAIMWIGNREPLDQSNQPRFIEAFEDVVRSVCPNLIQINPLVPSGALANSEINRPILSVSWARDLLFDIYQSEWEYGTALNAIGHSNHLLVDCQAVQRRAISLGASPDSLTQFPWGVELDDFCFRFETRSFDSLKILSLRSLEEFYKVDLLVDAAKTFFDRSISQQAKIGIANTGSQESELRSKVQSLELNAGVQFIGVISTESLKFELKNWNVYVSTSPIDGSSVSLLQCMAAGLICVVPDIDSNREWVDHGKTGFLYRANDSCHLAEVLLDLQKKSDSLDAIRRSARRIVEKRADWSVNKKTLLKVYNMVSAEG